MKNTLVSIQGLRCIAASCVVIAHCIINLYEKGAVLHGVYLEFAITIGGVGVNIFFTISGFIMVYNSFHSFGSSDAATDFFSRRLLRIVPLYLIATSFQFLNKFGTSPIYDVKHLIYSIFFIPYIGEGGNFRPVLGVGWTLNLEMFFYLIFAMSLLVPRALGFTLSILILSSLEPASKGYCTRAGCMIHRFEGN